MKYIFFLIFSSVLHLHCAQIEEGVEKRGQVYERDFDHAKNLILDHLQNSACSKEKIELIMNHVYQTRPIHCVEVGVFSGASAIPIAMTLKVLGKGKLHAIDAWSNKEATKNMWEKDEHLAYWSKVNMKEAYNKFKLRISHFGLKDYCKIVATTAHKAAKKFRGIDFLHLDGDVSEIGSINDVQRYLPKVSSGGYILFSNLFYTAHSFQTKLKAFRILLDHCDIIEVIDNNNTVLLKKR